MPPQILRVRCWSVARAAFCAAHKKVNKARHGPDRPPTTSWRYRLQESALDLDGAPTGEPVEDLGWPRHQSQVSRRPAGHRGSSGSCPTHKVPDTLGIVAYPSFFSRHQTIFSRHETTFSRYKTIFSRYDTIFPRYQTIFGRHQTIF